MVFEGSGVSVSEAAVDAVLYNRAAFERVLADSADVSTDLGLVTWLEAVVTTPGGWDSVVGVAVGAALQKEAWRRVVKIARAMRPASQSVSEVRYDLSVVAWAWLVENTEKFLGVSRPGWGYVLSVSRNKMIRAWHMDSSSGLGGRRNLPGVVRYTPVGDSAELDMLNVEPLIPPSGRRADFNLVEFGPVIREFIRALVRQGIPRLACERNVSLILACNMVSNNYGVCKAAWEFEAECLGIDPAVAYCWWKITVGSRDQPTGSLLYTIMRNQGVFDRKMLTRSWPDRAGLRRSASIKTIAGVYEQKDLLDLLAEIIAEESRVKEDV